LILVSHQLPRLRLSLDFMPSPDPDRPGLFIRDPYGFSDTMLVIPPPLVASLACFDGEQTTLGLRASLVQATGELRVGEIEKKLWTKRVSSRTNGSRRCARRESRSSRTLRSASPRTQVLRIRTIQRKPALNSRNT